ncbi:testis-expressed protein 15 [Manis javanica]|uniref:testis-expressed protein 15 n=1 Tax=Manis javanica TaxID=9974 RepID=UPI003C6D889C
MAVKEIANHKTLWKMNSTSEPTLEVSSMKKFTIPKIRRTAEKVYLSPCCTNTREYSFVHDILNQCRLDVSCDLQSSWQFGDTKLVHNEDLEKNFTSKRSEMRENGRHGRELEEHFGFLALPQSDVAEIYQNGISTKASTLKILGNPLLGIYIFRHVDVALNYAHCRGTPVESIIILKVLFGKVKKIQPSVSKNKVSLDPSPNFDCHMSRNTPSLKDSIELQAYNSAVYFYEYNDLSKPVDKPRQCLPYAIVTVKFVTQKVDNGHFMASLKFPSTGFPRRAGRTCSLNNCTVAKRIGKGKDATIIYEHFRKPVNPFLQENCLCNSEINPSNSNISNSFINVQNGNISVLETYSEQMEPNLAECRDTSQAPAYVSGLSSIPSDTRESVNGDVLLNSANLKNVLSGFSSALPPNNNTGFSTVFTSKLIKDPRLMKREKNMEKHNNNTGLKEVLPLEKSLNYVNSEIDLSSVPANSASSSEVILGDHAILTDCFDTHCFKVSFDNSQSQADHIDSKNCDYITPNKITTAGQCKNQDNSSCLVCSSNVGSKVKNQKQGEEKAQRFQQRSNIPLSAEQNNEPHNSYESVHTCTQGYDSHISHNSQSSSDLKTVYHSGHQISVVPLQRKEGIHKYIQNIGSMRNFTGPEDNPKHREKQNLWKEIDNHFTKETKISPVDNYISLHQEYKDDESLDSFGKSCNQKLIMEELEVPKSSTSTTKDKYGLDHQVPKLQNKLTPREASLSQNPQISFEYKDNMNTSFAISQKLIELKLGKPDQNSVGIMTDASQETKDAPQARELPVETVISSHDIQTAYDNSNCSIAREQTCVHRKNENDPVTLENILRDSKEMPHIYDTGQDHTLFYNAQLNSDTHLNIDFKGQRDNSKENQNEAKKEDIASCTENNTENIYEEQQVSHTDKNFTTIDEKMKNKNYTSVEIPSSKEFYTTFNLTWGKKYVSTATALPENEDTVTAVKQKDTRNTRRSVEPSVSRAGADTADSSALVASDAPVQRAGTPVPAGGANPKAHQRYMFKETWSSEGPDLSFSVKHEVSDSEVNVDKNKLCASFHQPVSDNSVIQSLGLENEIKVGLEQCDDIFLFQRNIRCYRNVVNEESDASYEALNSRIDWKGLLGSSHGQTEVFKNPTRRDNSDQHYSGEGNCFYAPSQKGKAQIFNPILLPDLQVKITNIFMPELSPTVESLALKDNFHKYETDASRPEVNEGKVPGFEIESQCSGENSHYPCEDKFDNIRQESGLVSKSETPLSFYLSHNTHVNHMSVKQNSGPLLTKPSNVTTNNERCSLTQSKTNSNDTRSKKDTESRIIKRKSQSPFRDQNLPHKDLRHHEIYGKKKRLTSQDSSECFSSLSQGRIETFSKSEKYIRSVLDILHSEAFLCKSKRISRKLDRAALHLKKAHRGVHASLQLVAKVGGIRKGPLPKSYAIICNNFWESCDLQGYSSVSERRYYSTKHFSSKRKYNKPGEKRALEFEVDKSLTHVSKYESYKTNGKRVTKCFSKKNVASSVSRSHTTIHVREFCDQEYLDTQIPLCSTSQSTSQSAYNNCSVKNPRSSELQPFCGKSEYLFSPVHPDQKLTKEENQIDVKFLPNIGKYVKLENPSAHNNIKDAAEEKNSEANEVINKSKSVTLSCIKENVSFSTEQNYNATCIAHTKVKTDIVISILESNVKHFLNVDIYKPDNSTLCGYKRDLDINFPTEKGTVSNESSKPDVTGNFLMDPLNLTLITSKKCTSIPQLSPPATVTDSEGESSQSYLDKQRITAVNSVVASTSVSHCQQGCGAEELLQTEQCSSNNCFHIDRNEINVTENSELGLPSITEESMSYGKNTMALFPNDSSLPLKDNIKSSSKKWIAKKDIQDRKMWEVKQAEKAKDSNHKKSTSEGSAKTDNKSEKFLEDSYLSEKTVKNSLIDSHLSIKNTTEVVSLNNTVSNKFNKREKEGKFKVSKDSQSDCTLHSETAYNSRPGIVGMNRVPISHAHSEISKVTTQKQPTSYMNELKEKHCSANPSALIASRLAQILRRADEASSLQILQEETKVCQNILPLFVEAFERKQECSLEQILISRELLVEQKLWNNYKHKLKPCALDSLVELQMVMETIQFIENKKRLLGGDPTFRSLLWYDETLYSELLGGPRGFQQQSNFYPAFQGRLKYNAFCELQNYHDQLIELFEETKRGKNSYYKFLKYKRQINECEAIMKQCSDCFDFSLSVPFACGVNFGDSLGDLEILRKSTLKLISVYGDSPKVDSYPEKQDHLWIIIEMITSKVNFIKSNEAINIKISLYGLEHIFFDAAKSLVWKEKRQCFSRKHSGKKNKEMLLKMNQYAFSKLEEINDTLSKDFSSEQIPSIGLENTLIASRKSDGLINKAMINIENCMFNSTLPSHPDICCINEILHQAELADLKKLQELTLRCTNHLEILKKWFQVLQEDNIENIFITEENVLDIKNYNYGATILKPEAIETYIEIVMLSETVHFLKNSMAKKQDKQRFRGMLWFDLSLLPELVQCQEKMASFSFVKDNSTDCLWRVIESAISKLKKDLDIIYKYSEAVNCSYALHLLSRELEELSEIKNLIRKCDYPISTYIDFVPYIASLNYGSTVTELEYNYNQFSTLLKNVMAAPQRDLGKMAHIMKVMKTIEDMKIKCSENAELTISFILCQMIHNRKKALQLKRKEKMDIPIKPTESINKSSACVKVPSVAEWVMKNISDSSRKRPITDNNYEDSQEQEKNTTVSSCKKQKVNMNDVIIVKRGKPTFKRPRTTGSHPESENGIGPSSSDTLKRNHVSQEKTEMQRSLPGSLPLKNLKDTCKSKSEGKMDLTNISSDTSEDFTRQQENLNSMKKRDVNFSAADTKSGKKDWCSFAVCDQNSVDGTFSQDHETRSQKLLHPDPAENSCPTNVKPGTDASLLLNASVLSKPIFCSVRDLRANLEMNDTVIELQDNEVLNSSIKNSTYTSSSEPMFTQNKISSLQINKTEPAKTESKEKHTRDTLNPSTLPVGESGNITLNVNQTKRYSFSEQQNYENSEVLTQNSATYRNGLPQSACTPMYNSSEHLFGTSSPYYAWCVYHYSSSGNSIMQTYQGITSYAVQPPPGVFTAVASTVQNTHSNLSYSQYFGYFPGEPQANYFVPVNGYFRSQMPVSYAFQQPVFSHYASHQPSPRVAYHYPPNSGVFPEAPWTYVPWRQEPFQPGH